MNKLHSAFLVMNLSVKHFLITCAEFNHIRTKYFNIKTIKELFDMSTQKILDFLKEIGLFNKI